VPALSSDSDKDGEDEGNDEDELRGLQSFHFQSSCNNERDSGINGRGAWAEVEKKGKNVKWEEDERHGLGITRYGQKEKSQDRNRCIDMNG